MKKLIYLSVLLLLFSCNSKEKKSTTEIEKEATSTEITDAKFGRQNYAVVWNWLTTEKEIFSDAMLTVSEEMQKLWEEDVIENSYFDNSSDVDDIKVFPNISFFIKAKTLDEAKEILDGLTLVKLAIADYSIFPVGTKWLGRNTDKIHETGVKKSYVTVWTTLNEPEIGDEITKKNSDAILELWNNGVIENVYFDIEGIQTPSDKRDFVFFVNADSEKEAKTILDELPVVTAEIASYKMYPVGVFWVGEYQEKN